VNDADLIITTPDTCNGAPRLRGTRVRVSNVLGLLASGMTPEAIVTSYPHLSFDDIAACAAAAPPK
jgi:uncharacterized protein (DUF433 family)